MKHCAWYVWFPNNVYANGPVRFDVPVSEQEFRTWLRECYLSVGGRTVKRLPSGTQVWPAT